MGLGRLPRLPPPTCARPVSGAGLGPSLLPGFTAVVSRPPPVASFSLCALRLFVIKRTYSLRAEVFAFRGARELLNKFHPTVLIEINPWFLDGFQLTMNDLTGPFHEMGYKVYRYDPELNKLIHVTDESTIVENNYLFIHPDYENRFSGLFVKT